MEIQIISFEISDYEEVHQLWTECEGVGLSEADGREGIKRYLARNRGMSFVAKEDGRIVGAILAGHDGRRGYLYHLAVRAEYRRQEIGRELVSGSVEMLQKAGIRKIHLFTYSKNEVGKAFWEANGFRRRKDIEVMTQEFNTGD